MQKCGWLVAAVAAMLLPVVAQAQGGVYAEGQRTSITGKTVGGNSQAGPSGSSTGIGATFGGFYDFYHLGPIGVGADARFAFSHDGSDSLYGNELNYGGANVRFSGVLPRFPVRPYVQAGVIQASTNYAFHNAMRGGLGYGYQAGADVDFAPHVAVRVEYAGGHLNSLRSRSATGDSLSFTSIQAGLVMWFGRN
ncbi:MAG: outer membrane beta-barrel protein [Acidobacteriaceae bacterium]